MIYEELKNTIRKHYEDEMRRAIEQLEKQNGVINNIEKMFQKIGQSCKDIFDDELQISPMGNDEYILSSNITKHEVKETGKNGFSMWIHVYIDTDDLCNNEMDSLHFSIYLEERHLVTEDEEDEWTAAGELETWDRTIGNTDQWDLYLNTSTGEYEISSTISEEDIDPEKDPEIEPEDLESYQKFRNFINSFNEN